MEKLHHPTSHRQPCKKVFLWPDPCPIVLAKRPCVQQFAKEAHPMKPTRRWQKSILQTARDENTQLPWANRKSRTAWRARCAKRIMRENRAA